jgi:hypothetical protein
VAQLGARFHGMEEVVGSIPTRSTNKSTAYTAAASGECAEGRQNLCASFGSIISTTFKFASRFFRIALLLRDRTRLDVILIFNAC